MIYFIIPIFNEEDNIKEMINQLHNRMKGCEYRVIAVNDGSADRSLEILRSIKEANVTIMNTAVNMNVGAVFSSGLSMAISQSSNEEDIAILMEGDQTSSMDVTLKLIDEIRQRGLDIVIASRYQNGGGFVNFPFMRRVYSNTANRLLRHYFPFMGQIKDYTIFFRVY